MQSHLISFQELRNAVALRVKHMSVRKLIMALVSCSWACVQQWSGIQEDWKPSALEQRQALQWSSGEQFSCEKSSCNHSLGVQLGTCQFGTCQIGLVQWASSWSSQPSEYHPFPLPCKDFRKTEREANFRSQQACNRCKHSSCLVIS